MRQDAAMQSAVRAAELAPVAAAVDSARPPAGLTAALRRPGCRSSTWSLPDYRVDRTPLGGEVSADRSTCRRGRRRRRCAAASTPSPGGCTWWAVPGIARSHPYLRPDGSGWPDNAGPLPRLQPGRRGDRPARAARRACTSTTGTPAPCWPRSGARHRPCSRCTTSPTRASPTGRGCAARSPQAGTTSGGAAPTRCRAPSPSPTRSSPRRRTTPARSSRRRAGSASTARCATAGPTVVGHPQRHRHGDVGPGDRPSPRGEVLGRPTRPASRAKAANRRALLRALRLARRRHAAGRDGVAADRRRRASTCIAPIVPVLAHIPMRLVVLGAGEPLIARTLAALAADHRGHVRFVEATTRRWRT